MRSLTIELNSKSIKKALKYMDGYKLRVKQKSTLLVGRLLDEGIKVAYQHTGRYTGYVEFTKDIQSGDKQCIGILIGKDTKPFISTWILKDGTRKQAQVSGILMSEFGSGWLANVIWSVPGVGQGTFPGQVHAENPNGWFWTDTAGKEHHSIGEVPYYPMYNAEMAMLKQIDSIAKEVFNGI